MSSGNHPETDGQTEVMNRITLQVLRSLIRPDQRDWDLRLPRVESAYNSSVHPATARTPQSLQFGWKPRMPVDFLFPEPKRPYAPGTHEFAVQFAEELRQATQNMLKAQERMVAQANKHRRPSPFRTDDLVWVSMAEFSEEEEVSRKLLPKWYGPWRILKTIGDDPAGPSYLVDVPPHLKTYPIFHASKLMPFTPSRFTERRRMVPPTMDGHAEIDRIVDHQAVRRPGHRGRPGKIYRVRFLYYPEEDDEWIDSHTLRETAPKIVAAYEKILRTGAATVAD
jgi:hypothetical protein